MAKSADTDTTNDAVDADMQKKPEGSLTKPSKGSSVSTQFDKVLKYLTGSELHLSRFQASMILMSFSYGSAVIILPNTVLRLGPVTWTLFVFIVVLSSGYCAYLNNQSTCYLIQERKCEETLRDPYPGIAELASGPVFRRIVAVVMYIAMISNCFGYLLLSATLMNDAFPFTHLPYYNSVRLWVCIICTAVAPLMYFGSFTDLLGAAIFAVTSSSVSLLCIIINCMVSHYHYGIEVEYTYVPVAGTSEADFFITFGLLTFAVAGPSFALPNIIVHVTERTEFPPNIACTFGVIFLIYLFAGTLPYVIFGKLTRDMVTETFKDIMAIKTFSTSAVLPILTIICDVGMSLHLLMEAILVINPVYQHFEDSLDVPREVSWKRIAVRTSGLVFMLLFCVTFPSFRAVLSAIGALPLTLVGIIFPLYIHSKIFDNTLGVNVMHTLIGLFFAIFIIGNFGVTLQGMLYVAMHSS